jgi:hypothetical protein
MRVSLTRHPDTPCEAVSSIDVDVERPRAGALRVLYSATGPMDGLALPPPSAPTRTVELWKHTCFEAFVRGGEVEAYCEFNFSPSTQWAAYAFDSYRNNMRAAEGLSAPRIEAAASPQSFSLNVSLDLDAVKDLDMRAIWNLGLAVVIEETNRRKSYWALAHPPGRADFHHKDGFAIKLPPPESS